MKFFEELPGGTQPRDNPIDWAKAKAELMQNPNLWGLVATNVSSSTSVQLNLGKNKNFRGEEPGNFEFRVRKPKDATGYGPYRSDLYGRYNVDA